MPLVVDAWQVTINGTTADGPYANVLHVTPVGGSDINTVAQQVLDAYCDNIIPVLCQSVNVVSARYVDLSSSSGPTGEVAPSSGVDTTGGINTDSCPPQIAYLVRMGGVSERGVRNGRMYLPGVREDQVDDRGDIATVTVGVVQDAVTAFIAQVLAVVTQPLVIVHNPSGGSPSTTEVLGSLVETPVATQRRRLKR